MKEERRAAAFLFHGIFVRVESLRAVANNSSRPGGPTRGLVARTGINAAAPHLSQFVGLCAVLSESALVVGRYCTAGLRVPQSLRPGGGCGKMTPKVAGAPVALRDCELATSG